MITSKKITGPLTTLFVAGPNEEHAVSCMLFCNQHTSQSVYVDVYAVPGIKDGETYNDWIASVYSGVGRIIKELEIKPLETFSLDSEKLVLSDGDTILVSSLNDDSSALESLVATISTMRVK